MLQSWDSNLFHKHKHWSVLLLLPGIERKMEENISSRAVPKLNVLNNFHLKQIELKISSILYPFIENISMSDQSPDCDLSTDYTA